MFKTGKYKKYYIVYFQDHTKIPIIILFSLFYFVFYIFIILKENTNETPLPPLLPVPLLSYPDSLNLYFLSETSRPPSDINRILHKKTKKD